MIIKLTRATGNTILVNADQIIRVTVARSNVTNVPDGSFIELVNGKTETVQEGVDKIWEIIGSIR